MLESEYATCHSLVIEGKTKGMCHAINFFPSINCTWVGLNYENIYNRIRSPKVSVMEAT